MDPRLRLARRGRSLPDGGAKDGAVGRASEVDPVPFHLQRDDVILGQGSRHKSALFNPLDGHFQRQTDQLSRESDSGVMPLEMAFNVRHVHESATGILHRAPTHSSAAIRAICEVWPSTHQ